MKIKQLKEILGETDYKFLLAFFNYVSDFDCMDYEQDLTVILEKNFHLFLRFVGFLTEYEYEYQDIHSRLNYASIAHAKYSNGGEFSENNESG